MAASEKQNAKAPRKGHDREYHVIPEDDGWMVERDESHTGLFSHDLDAAVAQAVAAAQRDHHNGLDVIVCVQEPGGHCRKVWP